MNSLPPPCVVSSPAIGSIRVNRSQGDVCFPQLNGMRGRHRVISGHEDAGRMASRHLGDECGILCLFDLEFGCREGIAPSTPKFGS
jgi:hypothetical protein